MRPFLSCIVGASSPCTRSMVGCGIIHSAEGNGKCSLKDRARFLDIARGLALECATIQDELAWLLLKTPTVVEF